MSLSTASSPVNLKSPPAAAILPLLLIFICGVAVGALAMSFVSHNALHRAAATESWNGMTVSRWSKELNLSAKQEKELNSSLDDLHKYYDNVLTDGKDRIMAILDDNQRRKFERMLEEKRKP